MIDNLPKPQRDSRGLWAAGNSGNPSGRPKKVAEIEALAQEHTAAALAKIVELLEHKDGRVALAAANSLLDRAFGKPAQAVKAEVQTFDIAKLWLQAVQMKPEPKAIEAEPVQTTIVNGMATPLVDAGRSPAGAARDNEGADRW